MNVRRFWIVFLVVLMVGTAAAMGTVMRKDVAALRETEAAIAEQKKILAEVGNEKKAFRDKLEETVKSMKSGADSTSEPDAGAVFDMSFIAGKEQTVLDQKEWRAEKRLAFQEDRRVVVRKSLLRRGGLLGAAELILLGAVFIVSRRPVGSKPA